MIYQVSTNTTVYTNYEWFGDGLFLGAGAKMDRLDIRTPLSVRSVYTQVTTSNGTVIKSNTV
jgi:hypothetical protein